MARQSPPPSCFSDTLVIRKIFKREYLLIETEFLVENSCLVSRDNKSRRGSTKNPGIQLFTWSRTNFWLKILALYQENIRVEEVARQSAPSNWSPDTWVFRKIFEREYLLIEIVFLAENSTNPAVQLFSWSRKNFWLKILVLYQENIRIEEVARQSVTCNCSPDIAVFRKIYEREYLLIGTEFLPENSSFVSGEHKNRRGGTTKRYVQLFSWYCGFSKNIWTWISPDRDKISGWKF